MLKTIITPLFCLLFVLQPILCPAPVFMKLGDIKGDVVDEAHFEWSAAHSVAFDVDRSGGPAADAQFADLVCVKRLDKSSPKLMEACATGTYFPQATFDLTRALPDGGEQPYLRYKLTDVLVSSYSFHGSSSGDPLPTEEITLNYEEVKFTYRGIRKTYIQYDENGDLVEVVSVGLPARVGGTPPPPDSSANGATETLGELDESTAADGDTTEAESIPE